MTTARRKLSFPKRRMSITEIRSLNSNDLILSSKWCLAFTAIFLLYGLPFVATCVSAFGLVLFPFQTKSFYHLLKDLRKWVLLSAFAFVASFKSYVILELASKKTEHESYSYFLWLSGTAIHTVAGGFLAYCLYTDYLKEPENAQSTIQFLEVRVHILKGRNLVAKDHNIFGKPTTSDPYVRVLHNNHYVGETAIVWKTLNPTWKEERFILPVVHKTLIRCNELESVLMDRDKFSKDDNMGTVMVPIPQNLNMKVCQWYKVGTGQPGSPNYCPDPTGELQVEVEVRQLLSKRFKRQLHRKSSDSFSLSSSSSGRNLFVASPKKQRKQQPPRNNIPMELAKSIKRLDITLEDDDLASQATDEIHSLDNSSSSPDRTTTIQRRKAFLSPSSAADISDVDSSRKKKIKRRLSSGLKKLPRISSLSPKRNSNRKASAMNKIPRKLQ
ncbi:unnamed protein product [Cylindrotheca closterium]|uniref:C2 domain-containing protein n=1 Tax=Cylindrotheca closterium TaxID=2856 RepID=A0AAD2G9C3_9STRA|nr:unnamed protein product [Cylindrotheca closterium]